MNTNQIKAIQYKKGEYKEAKETVVIDKTLHLTINNLTPNNLNTNKLTPNNTIKSKFSVLDDSIKEFITGNMLTEGIISSIEDINSLKINSTEDDINVDVEVKIKDNKVGTDDNEDIIPIESELKVKKDEILENMEKLRENALIWQATGGCHVAAIVYKDQFIVKEDVSRHVAVDKVIGAGAYEGFDLSKAYIIYSGRMPKDMIIKLVRTKIPILISNAAPSYSGIKIAEKGNITLVGFVRGNRFNVYTHTNRIEFD